MGQVWRASTRTGDPVAIKLLRPELASDATLVTRFLQEAQLLTTIHDPHLVAVRDLVAEGSSLGIVMDLVQGPDLRTALVEQGTFAPHAAARLTDGVLAGLTAVHAAGVVHRDVKPENVLLAGDPASPVPLLTDFGIARIFAEGQSTRRTTVIGTPDYIAPEVANGGVPTPASDLYAVGIMLYELLVGVTPFAGDSPLAVLRRHVEQLPGRPEGIPDGLWAIISALLAKDPANRPQSAGEVRSALANIATTIAGAPRLARLQVPPAPLPADLSTTVLGGLTAAPAPPSGDGAATVPATKPKKRRGLLIAAIVVVVLAAGGTAGAIVLTGGGKKTHTARSTSPRASDASSPTTTSSSPGGSDSGSASPSNGSPDVVPAVTGKTLNEAETAIENAGLQVRVNEILDAAKPDNTVTAQDPADGTTLAGGGTVTLSVARQPVGVFLADLNNIVTRYGGNPGTSLATMNGVSYTHALSAATPSCVSTPPSFQYDLGRDYRQLTTTVGVSDDSPSDAIVLFEVLVDGRNVFSQTATLGKPVAVKVDVTGGLRLEIDATQTGGSCSNTVSTTTVWADAELFGVPDQVPSPSSSPTN